jgi:hypothetical protein
MSKVKIATCRQDSTDLIGVSPNNSDFGYIRVVSSEGLSFGAGGWLNSRQKSTLIKGKITDLQEWVRKNNIQVESEIPGKIVVKESLTPFYETQQPKRSNPEGPVLYKTVGGINRPIYRQTEFTLDDTIQDELIQHDNVLSTQPVATGRMQPNSNVKVS